MNALWTALIVAAVKLVPLIFLAMKLMFQSVMPLAGFAAFGGSGASALSLFGGTSPDDATPLTDDDYDDYGYDDYRTAGKRKRSGRRRHAGATKAKGKRLIDEEFDEDLDDAADMVDDDSLEDDFEHKDQLDDDDLDADDMDDDEFDEDDASRRPTANRHHHSLRRRT